MSDIATALTNALCKDGQSTPTANIKMGGFKHTGLGAGSAATDSANLGQVQAAAYALLGSVSGTDTITAAGSPVVAAYAAGQTFRFVSAGANTGAVTLNIDSLGAKAVTKNGTTALVAGDIPSGAVCEVVYDGTRFQLLGVVADRAAKGANSDITSLSGLTTPLSVAQGGTGGASASAARTALGVAIGTDVQAYDANLRPLVASTAQATTSGTSIDFTSIPSWVKRITVMFNAVSTNGSSNYMLQIGDSGGVAATSYVSAAWQGGSGDTTANTTAGFILTASTAAAANYTGACVLTNLTGNQWIAQGTAIRNTDGIGVVCSGNKALSATLTRVRLTTVSGTDTFDAGSVNILYE